MKQLSLLTTKLKKLVHQFSKQKKTKTYLTIGTVIVLLICGTGIVAAKYLFQEPVVTFSYTLDLQSRINMNEIHTLREKEEVDVHVIGQASPAFLKKPTPFTIQANLDQTEIFQTTFIPNTESTNISVGVISLDPKVIKDGEHTGEVILKVKGTDQILDKKRLLFSTIKLGQRYSKSQVIKAVYYSTMSCNLPLSQP